MSSSGSHFRGSSSCKPRWAPSKRAPGRRLRCPARFCRRNESRSSCHRRSRFLRKTPARHSRQHRCPACSLGPASSKRCRGRRLGSTARAVAVVDEARRHEAGWCATARALSRRGSGWVFGDRATSRDVDVCGGGIVFQSRPPPVPPLGYRRPSSYRRNRLQRATCLCSTGRRKLPS
jgi:hypothetical protein